MSSKRRRRTKKEAHNLLLGDIKGKPSTLSPILQKRKGEVKLSIGEGRKKPCGGHQNLETDYFKVIV